MPCVQVRFVSGLRLRCRGGDGGLRLDLGRNSEYLSPPPVSFRLDPRQDPSEAFLLIFNLIVQFEIIALTWRWIRPSQESRDYFDSRWGGNPAYHGCFITRWFSSVAACGPSNGETGTKFLTRGGWFDTIGTSPESYIEQARQTILGGATESVLFDAGALMGGVDDKVGGTSKDDAEALRANMVELQHVARQVGSRVPIGIAAYLPPANKWLDLYTFKA